MQANQSSFDFFRRFAFSITLHFSVAHVDVLRDGSHVQLFGTYDVDKIEIHWVENESSRRIRFFPEDFRINFSFKKNPLKKERKYTSNERLHETMTDWCNIINITR